MMNKIIRTTLITLLLTFAAHAAPNRDYRLPPSSRNTESKKG